MRWYYVARPSGSEFFSTGVGGVFRSSWDDSVRNRGHWRDPKLDKGSLILLPQTAVEIEATTGEEVHGEFGEDSLP